MFFQTTYRSQIALNVSLLQRHPWNHFRVNRSAAWLVCVLRRVVNSCHQLSTAVNMHVQQVHNLTMTLQLSPPLSLVGKLVDNFLFRRLINKY